MSVEARSARRRRRALASGRGSLWTARLVMTFVCVVWITPSLGAVINMFRPSGAANTSGWWTVFAHPSELAHVGLGAIDTAVNGQLGLGRAMLNSAAVSVPATVLPMIVSTVTAYALVFLRFPGRQLFYTVLVMVLLVPGQVAVLPLLKLYSALGVQGTIPALYLVLTAFAIPLNTYLLRGYLLQLRTELVDSARVDGASELQIVWRIVTPLAAPAILALSVFQFLASWNELFLSLSFLGGDGDTQTAPMALTGAITSLQTLSAGAVITVIVPVTVFLVLQGRLLRGLTVVTGSDG